MYFCSYAVRGKEKTKKKRFLVRKLTQKNANVKTIKSFLLRFLRSFADKRPFFIWQNEDQLLNLQVKLAGSVIL
jgi:hypothetical protein